MKMTSVLWYTKRYAFAGIMTIVTLITILLHSTTTQEHTQVTSPAAIHVTTAEMVQFDSTGISTAPAIIDSTTLSKTWGKISLPYASPSELLRKSTPSTAESPSPNTLISSVTNATTIAWYRLKVSNFTAGAYPLMLYTARVKVEGPIAVYLDGHLIHQLQLAGPTWYWPPLWLELDNGERSAIPHEILFRLQYVRHTNTALASVWLGSSAALGWRYQARQWLQVYIPMMSSGAFLAVGLFALVVWFKREQGKGYGLFALLAGAQFIRSLHFFCDFPLANDWFAWISVNSLFWVIAIVHAFQVLMHGKPQRWLSTILNGIIILIGLLSLPIVATLPNTPEVTPLIYLLAMAASITVTIAGFIASWRHSSEAMLVTIGIGLCFLYGVSDWALQSNFLGPENWYLGPYMNLQNFVMFCYLMYRRYIGALTHVENSNEQLALRLRAREDELAQSYSRLSEIEHKQTVAEERQRLMQDMHDGLGSSLHSALRAIERGSLDAIAVSDILRACIDDLHLTIDSMEPVEANLLLLLATLRYRLGNRLQSATMKLHWEVVDVPSLEWIDPRTALHILRILQEALTNIVKHTKATEIHVATGFDERYVHVSISDNGAGFYVESVQQSGNKGLGNQKRRAAAIGGDIQWKSNHAGTKVTLWLPQARPM